MKMSERVKILIILGIIQTLIEIDKI